MRQIWRLRPVLRRVAQFWSTLLLVLIVFTPTPGIACSCAYSTPQQMLAQTDAVFAGQVARISEPLSQPILTDSFPFITLAPPPNEPLTVTINVTQVWKGPAYTELVFESDNPATSQCGFYYERGASYIVYAYNRGNRLERIPCLRTLPLSNAAEDLAALGPGNQLLVPGSIDTASFDRWWHSCGRAGRRFSALASRV